MFVACPLFYAQNCADMNSSRASTYLLTYLLTCLLTYLLLAVQRARENSAESKREQWLSYCNVLEREGERYSRDMERIRGSKGFDCVWRALLGLRTARRAKVPGNLPHISSHQGATFIRTSRLSVEQLSAACLSSGYVMLT